MQKIRVQDNYRKIKEISDGIDKKLKEERQNPNADRHKIYRLLEEKSMPGLFSDPYSTYGKYNTPW